MKSGQSDERLREVVDEFVEELQGTVTASLDCVVEDSKVYATLEKSHHQHIGYEFAVVARVAGEPTFRFEALFTMTWNTARAFPAVERSAFTLYVVPSNEPLFHYDYYRDPQGRIPGAHINIHHQREDLRAAMEKSGQRYRGKAVQKKLHKGESVSDSELHYPVGGPRFRPAVEDVIQFMVFELGVDVQNDWQPRLESGRVRWRERQLRAAVSDNLHVAADELRHKGFEVNGGPLEDPNSRRLKEL